MDVLGFWAAFILLSAGAVKALAVIFPRTWDAILEAWGEPEWRR